MEPDDPQTELNRLLAATGDRSRPEAVAARRARGYRTARENLDDLCDPGSFVEYGLGGMGLEGAVRLGYRKELEAESDPEKREQLFHSLLAGLYVKGRAIEAATHLEIDAVIDPADTRRLVSRAFAAAAG